jgi:APA family basic amino acid/polyamine antiporter
VTIRGVPVPVPALVGAPLTATLLAFAIATHESAQIAGPLWLVLGIAVFVAVRMARRERVLARVTPAVGDLVPEVEGVYKRILVPVKLGDIGDEMLATAVKLAAEHDARICALHVEHVPLDRPLETNGSRESEAGARPSRRRASSPPSTASRSTCGSSVPARSARRSSRRRSARAPT